MGTSSTGRAAPNDGASIGSPGTNHSTALLNVTSTPRRPSLLRNRLSSARRTGTSTPPSNGNSSSAVVTGSPTTQLHSLNAGSSSGGANITTNDTTMSPSASTKSKALVQTLSHNLQNHLSSNQYVAQEKAYLKKLKNQLVDDYYTKGITEEARVTDEDEDDEYTPDKEEDHSNLLVDMDDDKYQIDFALSFGKDDISYNHYNFNNSGTQLPSKISIMPNKNITQLRNDDTDDPAVIERLEWQSMLTSVLTGDVVRAEKTRINDHSNPENVQESLLHATYKENLWYGIRAKILNRTEEDQRRITSYRRTLVDQIFEDISKFEVTYDDPTDNSPRSQVVKVIERYESACSLWRTMEEMKNDKPICREADFQHKIDALNAWLSITDAIARERLSLQLWIGNDELDITKGSPAPDTTASNSGQFFNEETKSLAERLMKEKGVQATFRNRIFIPIVPWMIKSKDTYIRLGNVFEAMKLPDYIHDLIHICVIPMKLIKEIIKVRLTYAMKLQNPTLMMIDQMIDDFKSYITIALEVKSGIQAYCKTDDANTWIIGDLFESETSDFDKVVVRSVRYFLTLLNKKLLDSSKSPLTFRTFREPDELESTWNYLKWVGNFIEGGSVVVAEEISLLALKLIYRSLAYYNNQIRNPQGTASLSELIRWYSATTENFGQLRRKLSRFSSEIFRDFTNSIVFEIPASPNHRTKNLLDVLQATNHFLVYTGTVETQGTYFFASSELIGNDQEILKIINGTYVGQDPNEANFQFSEFLRLIQTQEQQDEELVVLEPDSSHYSYVLAFCPPQPIVWEGIVVNIDMDEVPITDVKLGQMLLITKLPNHRIHHVKEKFLNIVGDVLMVGGVLKPVEQRCSLAKVHTELTKINRNFFKMIMVVLDSVSIVKEKCRDIATEGGYQGLVNTYYSYARDFGKNSIKLLESLRKSSVIMKLIDLSIDWVSFICDDCAPTDRKTFRWCVLALEFAMDMTRGFNVLVLSDEQFNKLKIKVARCMSLLISHFDIMGTRSSEIERNKVLKWSAQRHQRIENSADDDYIFRVYTEDMMKEIQIIENYRETLQAQSLVVGRVLDISDLEYQFVTLLASSFSSVSIRWQKGRFIGGGTFGHVFEAINLDTGGVMAVKEIRFHDSQSIKNLVPLIKDEMTVLEMLNHPNVVQYFGVEVHRDKVYIFMEFCEGGSLSGLLTHGRIEDEMVIQVYTLQMLEGLGYLHQSGVVHRDIKPENILLDHNGVIKFVDFGAAKVISTSGRTRAGLSSTTPAPPTPGVGAVGATQNNIGSMTGTPMYMSPEVITGTSNDKSGVVDIWSLGCCVLEMATGRRPWANLDNEWAIMYHIAAGHKPQLPSPEQLSEAGRTFLSRCLEHDPTKRPSAFELLNDPWIVAIRQVAFGSGENSSTPSSEFGEEK